MLDISRAYGLDFLFPEKDAIIGKSLKLAGEFAKAEMDILIIRIQMSDMQSAIAGAILSSVLRREADL